MASASVECKVLVDGAGVVVPGKQVSLMLLLGRAEDKSRVVVVVVVVVAVPYRFWFELLRLSELPRLLRLTPSLGPKNIQKSPRGKNNGELF